MTTITKQSTESIWSRIDIPKDARSMTFFAKPTSTWEQMEAWFEKTYPDSHWVWKGFGTPGEEDFSVVLIKKFCENWDDGCRECGSHDSDDDDDSSTSSEESEDSVPDLTTAYPFPDGVLPPDGFVAKDAEDDLWEYDADDDKWNRYTGDHWCMECDRCAKWLGNKIFTDEAEYDSHSDREAGFVLPPTETDAGVRWFCPECRKEVEDSDGSRRYGVALRIGSGECDDNDVEYMNMDYPLVVEELYKLRLELKALKAVKCVGAEGAPSCEAVVKGGDTICDDCFAYVEKPKKTKEERMAELEKNLRSAFGETDKSAFP